jgi:hypothetical protein
MPEPLPTRSITRFLLPMADVMALLFSLFLLLPHLEQQPGRLTGQAVKPGSYWTPDEQRQVREELDRLRRLSQLPANQKLSLVVLDIDGATGNLLFREGNQVITLASQADIDALVKKHLESARVSGKELLYVLRLPPPGVFDHPNYADEEKYGRWFGAWKVDYQIPGLRRPSGT